MPPADNTLDTLLASVQDESLRQQLRAEFARRSEREFGLVFERHSPEHVGLRVDPARGIRPRVGDRVQLRSEPKDGTVYEVRSIRKGVVQLAELDDRGQRVESEGAEVRRASHQSDLIVLRSFGAPVYPGLTFLGRSEGTSRVDGPAHAVINSENFHALQMLVHGLEGQVDCIYIDPPYNTGDTAWKYNNRYVDKGDRYRHSRWLSFMEKRLKLAKKLLRPDGVLIATIDEHEVHNLGLLLRQMFPNHDHTMVTIVIHGRGNDGKNFDRVDEYAFFVCPAGERVTSPRPHDSLNSLEAESTLVRDRRTFVRTGNNSTPDKRPGMFYPLWVNEKTGALRAGSVTTEKDFPTKSVGGEKPLRPVDTRGITRVWRYNPASADAAILEGLLEATQVDGTWKVHLATLKKGEIKHRTVWKDSSHASKNHGTALLTDVLGSEAFSYPKSLYAVRDCLAAVLADRPDALVLDFFAGSGTTLHATALLNQQDDGRRRCILVTNNELAKEVEEDLHRRAKYAGDDEYEAEGVFEKVTRPRCVAALTGKRADGTPVPGNYLSGGPRADGLPGAVEFFRLDYFEKDEIALGTQFDKVHPVLWLAAGAAGRRPANTSIQTHVIAPPGCRYAVLTRPEAAPKLTKLLEERDDITHVWVVTDSTDTYAAIASQLPVHLQVQQLYRHYVETFRINTEANL